MRFIRGGGERLTNGWFAVKQPATADLKQGITWEEAREQERLFFSTTSPWSTETEYRHRFGTKNLTESLSSILSDLIRRRLVPPQPPDLLRLILHLSRSSLPELEDELQKFLQDTEASLSEFPPSPSDDAQGDAILLVSNFARELATYVEGTPDDDGIHQLIRPLNEEFLEEIRSTAQPFSPFETHTQPFQEPISSPGGMGVPFIHPGFLASDIEPTIYSGDDDTICINEVMEMANG